MSALKILITGGAGFIGTALSTTLTRLYNTDIVAYDNLLRQVHPTGSPPPDFPPSVCLLRSDVQDFKAWRNLFTSYEPDYVIHLAAETGTSQSLVESSRHAGVNVVGTTAMLDAMVALGRRPKGILLSSSRAVYGEGAWRSEDGTTFYPGRRGHRQLAQHRWVPLGPDGRPGMPISHAAATVFPNPSSIYGATKLAQEHVLSSWCDAYSVPLSILRFQNVYGRGQSPTNPYTGIINIFHRTAARGEAINVFEDGNIGRDFIYIDDVVTACVAALFRKNPDTLLCDIGTGNAITIMEAATIIARLHHAPVPVISGQFRDGDIRWAVADTGIMESVLGIKPRVEFAEGLKLVGSWLEESGYAS